MKKKNRNWEEKRKRLGEETTKIFKLQKVGM